MVIIEKMLNTLTNIIEYLYFPTKTLIKRNFDLA